MALWSRSRCTAVWLAATLVVAGLGLSGIAQPAGATQDTASKPGTANNPPNADKPKAASKRAAPPKSAKPPKPKPDTVNEKLLIRPPLGGCGNLGFACCA